MSDKTKIEWTDATWNPIVGCSKCSPGCLNCYAERMAARLASMGKPGYEEVVINRKWNGKLGVVLEKLPRPLQWKRPRKIFVCSMSDLFHEKVHFGWVENVFEIIKRCPHHTFITLTKRPERMLEFQQNYFPQGLPGNVWCGVTVCNQAEADQNISIILQVKSEVRFLSVEPMLEAVDLSPKANLAYRILSRHYGSGVFDPTGSSPELERKKGVFPELDWVICGGESGPGARPVHEKWVRDLRDQCKAAGTAFLFKQWGEYLPLAQDGSVDIKDTEDGTSSRYPHQCWMGDQWEDIGRPDWVSFADDYNGESCVRKVGKHKAGRILDGVIHNGYPKRG